MTEATKRVNGLQSCPQCGTQFTCEVAAGQTQCWCFHLPRIITSDDTRSTGCLCPACLGAKIAALQASDEQV